MNIPVRWFYEPGYWRDIKRHKPTAYFFSRIMRVITLLFVKEEKKFRCSGMMYNRISSPVLPSNQQRALTLPTNHCTPTSNLVPASFTNRLLSRAWIISTATEASSIPEASQIACTTIGPISPTWNVRVGKAASINWLATAVLFRSRASYSTPGALRRSLVASSSGQNQCCGSVYSIYGSGSSTLTIYGSGSRRVNDIRIQMDPDPTAGFYKT